MMVQLFNYQCDVCVDNSMQLLELLKEYQHSQVNGITWPIHSKIRYLKLRNDQMKNLLVILDGSPDLQTLILNGGFHPVYKTPIDLKGFSAKSYPRLPVLLVSDGTIKMYPH
jgi:hypothetical protein